MSIHKCFDETLKKYNITGASLARQVSISPSHISQFRNGKGGDVSHTTLEKMLEALESLAPGSKLYFCLLLAGKNPVEFLANPSSYLSTLVLAAVECKIICPLAKLLSLLSKLITPHPFTVPKLLKCT